MHCLEDHKVLCTSATAKVFHKVGLGICLWKITGNDAIIKAQFCGTENVTQTCGYQKWNYFVYCGTTNYVGLPYFWMQKYSQIYH